MAEEGIGYVISFNGIINTSGNSLLRLIPLENQIETDLQTVWKKYRIFTKAAEKFPDYLRKILHSEP